MAEKEDKREILLLERAVNVLAPQFIIEYGEVSIIPFIVKLLVSEHPSDRWELNRRIAMSRLGNLPTVSTSG